MLPNRKKSSKNALGGKKSVKVEKTEKEEEEELEAMKLELENEQKKAEETEKITKELEKRFELIFFLLVIHLLGTRSIIFVNEPLTKEVEIMEGFVQIPLKKRMKTERYVFKFPIPFGPHYYLQIFDVITSAESSYYFTSTCCSNNTKIMSRL